MLTALAIVLLAAVVVLWIGLLRCPHLDDDGESALVWIVDRRTRTVRGWCPYCLTKTRAQDYPYVAPLTRQEWGVIARSNVRRSS